MSYPPNAGTPENSHGNGMKKSSHRAAVLGRRRRAALLYDCHGQALLLMLLFISDNMQRAEKILADVIIEASAELDVSVANHRAIRKKLAARAYRLSRAADAHRPPIMPAAAEARGLPVAGHAPQSPITDALTSLREDQRIAVALCFFGGHEYRELARLLSCTPTCSAALLRTALLHLAPPVPPH